MATRGSSWLFVCSRASSELRRFYILTVHLVIILGKWPTDQLDAQFFPVYLFQFSTCFEQPRAHHQENQLYQYNIWYMSLCVGDRFVCRSDLHTKRSPTQSDIYQMLYWYNWFSWWWARGCSKHVENWNKYTGKNCASSWSFTENHGIYFFLCVIPSNTTILLKPGYRNSLRQHVSVVTRPSSGPTKSSNMQRATNFFCTQWDPIVFTLVYKTLSDCQIVMLM